MFDMNKCKPGDVLVSVCGAIFTYVEKNDSHAPYKHTVAYPDGMGGMRADDGSVFLNRDFPSAYDIVGFYKEGV